MQKAIKSRSAIRASFSKLITKLNKLMSEQDIDIIEVKANYTLLENKYGDLVKIDAEIYEYKIENSTVTEQDLNVELEKCDEFSVEFNKMKNKVEQIGKDTQSSQDNNQSTKCMRKFKLPVLEFNKFSGKLEEWLPFWSQFKKVNDDNEIDDSDKILYLRQAVVPGSRAQDIVDSFPATGDNYNKVIKCLKSRFGRDDLLIEVYIRQLLSLVIQNISSKDINISVLYDKLESKLRALETLGVTTEKCAAMLLPLVESCLPEIILRTWQRNAIFSNGKLTEPSPEDEGTLSSKERLDLLMKFIRAEVQSEQKVALALDGFGFNSNTANEKSEKCNKKSSSKPTAATLITTMSNYNNINNCLFCDGKHSTTDCFKASNMPYAKKEEILKQKRACFSCLKVGHLRKYCRSPRFKCIVCGKNHHVSICNNLTQVQEDFKNKNRSTIKNDEKRIDKYEDKTLANFSSEDILLQTLVVILRSDVGDRKVRAIIDTGSQKSYVLSKITDEVNYEPIREEQVRHMLFGGSSTETLTHKVFRIYLADVDKTYYCNFEALSQPMICENISCIKPGPWIDELNKKNIKLTDFSDEPVQILIGADVAGKLLTGRREVLKCGLVAIETYLGWTLMGKIRSSEPRSNVAMTITNLLSTQREVNDLWSLDAIGILDPSEKRTKEQLHQEALEHFNNTVKINNNGRYEVQMPWLDNHSTLPSNYELAYKRLNSVVKKLQSSDSYKDYNNVFREWENEGIIEEINEIEHSGHFLPHRPVYRDSSTTNIRPVFDASAREKGHPSLNNCLEVGVNLVELIPEILNRFRINKIGVSADIRKAFLQIGLAPNDRNFLKFLWINEEGKMIIYRHCRVVFGVSCSPFLLGVTINHHLNTLLNMVREGKSSYALWVLEKLLKSFYVDNCLASVHNELELNQFIEEATNIMKERKFDLRGWEYSAIEKVDTQESSHVLGLLWNSLEDTLKVNIESLEKMEVTKVTKRVILSAAHRLFDPIGITCCVSLLPKLLIQETWQQKLGWEEEVEEEMKIKFIKWMEGLKHLSCISIPRWLVGTDDSSEKTLHIFCDASKSAYAAVAFLRVETSSNILVRLVLAKSRVATLGKQNKRTSIPRLELLAATIGARIYNSFLRQLEIRNLRVNFWTDSSTVLAWISRQETWDVFVRNRVEEIRKLTPNVQWKHIPGPYNPADLASRGCTADVLVKSKWWEGPTWLADKCTNWPASDVIYDEEEINKEKKVSVISSLCYNLKEHNVYTYFSSYGKIVRLIGWMYRFIRNSKTRINKTSGDLSTEEYQEAELKLIRFVQREAFTGVGDSKILNLQPFKDEKGVIRLRTKISARDDSNDFCYPIVLPDRKHPVVWRLIMEKHREACHAGVEIMLSVLRQRYWILGGRRNIRGVLSKCQPCKRHNAKHFVVHSPPLPEDRVKDARVFEVVGMDMAGPVYVKSDTKDVTKKAWICIYTCAIYRAVHLELLSSLTTDRFLQSFRRFIRRRGRPSVVYCDNGRNFLGAANSLEALNWDKITQASTIQKIKWKFNPPAAPWWGGWWERLIQILKQLLRRVLGRANLDFEELQSILCDCEEVINSRPLTYSSDSDKSTQLIPLTPNMFLRDIDEGRVTDFDMLETANLNKRLEYRRRLREDLNKRFRDEYLGQLMLHSKRTTSKRIKLGDIVLVESENLKRLDWPLAKIEELIEGRDGEVRCVRLRTANGLLIRPIQRIYPLEITSEENATVLSVEEHCPADAEEMPERNKCTRSGRRVKIPVRFEDD